MTRMRRSGCGLWARTVEILEIWSTTHSTQRAMSHPHDGGQLAQNANLALTMADHLDQGKIERLFIAKKSCTSSISSYAFL